MVRWVPYQKMVVLPDEGRSNEGNDALNQFLRSGVLSLVDVSDELSVWKTDPSFKKRSHAASQHWRVPIQFRTCIQLTKTLQRSDPATRVAQGDLVRLLLQ